jgi:hypothetical protein
LSNDVGHVESSVAELQIDGSELVSFGNIDGSLGEFAGVGFELGPNFVEDGLNALFAGEWGGHGCSS